MTQQIEQIEQIPQETVTESLLSGTDAISRDQQVLDKDAPTTSETASRADFDAQTAQIQQLRGEIRGLQGIAQRSETKVQEWETERQKLGLEQLLEELPEEQKTLGKMVGSLTQKMLTLEAQQATPTSAPAKNGLSGPDAENARQTARTLGVDENDSRINYAALAETTGDVDSRYVKFIDSVYRVKMGVTAPQAPPTQQAQATERSPVEPPMSEDTIQGEGLAQDEMDIVGLMGTGNLTPIEGKERLRKIGSSLFQ